MYISGGRTTLTNCYVTSNSGGYRYSDSNYGGNAGGLYISGGTTSLANCYVTSNFAGVSGGGFYISGGTTMLTNCYVTSNLANSGGGLGITNGKTTLTNSYVTSNSAFSSGGGLFISDGTTTLTNCSVTSNSGLINGGGLYISSGTTTLTNCYITRNSAGFYLHNPSGGGLYISSGATMLTNCYVTSNSAYGNGNSKGGGLYISGGRTTLTNCHITSNSANSSASISAGGSSYSPAFGGGFYISGGTTTLTNCYVTSNLAYPGTDGGGLHAINSPYIWIANCQFSNNSLPSIRLEPFVTWYRINMEDVDLQNAVGLNVPEEGCSDTLCKDAGIPGTACLQRDSNMGLYCHGYAILPPDRTEMESTTVTYPLALSVPPENKPVMVHVFSRSCNLPSLPLLLFTSANYSTGQMISISLPGNNIDEREDEMTICDIVHNITSVDEQYKHSPPSSFNIRVLNDDTADVKLQIPMEDGSFQYRLKAMGPITIDEGSSASFALVLDTEPTANVTVVAWVIEPRQDTPLKVHVKRSSVLFTASNWMSPQLVTVAADNDDIDNDKDRETFEVVCFVRTNDSVFQSQATNSTVILQVQDDDTAGVQFDQNIVTLNEDGDWKPFVVHALTTKPLRDVSVTIRGSDDSLQADPSEFLVQKDHWNVVNRSIKVRAVGYAGQESSLLYIKTFSADPKYNDTRFGSKPVIVNSDVELAGAPTNVSRALLNATALIVAWDGGYAEVQWSPSPTFEPFATKLMQSNSPATIQTDTPLHQEAIYVRVRAVSPRSHWSASTAPWTVTRECDVVKEYLNASKGLKDWRCEACPEGAFCTGQDVTWKEVQAMHGWWRQRPFPEPSNFSQCLFSGACLGAPKEPEACNVAAGYRQGSRLCADCISGYSRDGEGQCKPCADQGLNNVVVGLVGLGMSGCLVFLVWSTVVKRGGSFRISNGVKKIFISFLQLASLSSTMNIPWPANYLSLFRFQSLVSSAGEEFVDLRCTIGDVPIAYVEYGTAAAYAALPFGLVLASFLVWSTCGRCCVQKEKRNAMMTGTITLLLYLVYPSITGKALGIWRCRTVPGVGSIFVVDPETLCTDDLHLLVTYGLALPMVLGYVVGLPVLARYLLYKFRAKLDEPNTRARFGLLCEGFRREAYLHETWVILRKVLIIVVGTFFSEKLQVLFALGIVGVMLTHTVMAQPFKEENLTRLETMLLCCCFLTLWVGGIFVVYPECGSSEDYARVLCHGMEGAVLALNIVCMIMGMGAYVWYTWTEQHDTILNKIKALRAKGSALLDKFPRRKRATWESNPIAGSVEMKALEAALGNGKKANGKEANSKKANSKKANGKKANGKKANGKETINENIIGKNAAPMVENPLLRRKDNVRSNKSKPRATPRVSK